MADYVHNLGVLCSEAPRNDMVILPSVLPTAPPPPPPPPPPPQNALSLGQNGHASQPRQHGIEALLNNLSLSSMQRLGQAGPPNPLGPPGRLGALGMGQHVLPSQGGLGGYGSGLNPSALNPNALLGTGAQPGGRPLPGGRGARFKAPNPSSNQYKLGPSLGALAGGQAGGAMNSNPMGFGAPPAPRRLRPLWRHGARAAAAAPRAAAGAAAPWAGHEPEP